MENKSKLIQTLKQISDKLYNATNTPILNDKQWNKLWDSVTYIENVIDELELEKKEENGNIRSTPESSKATNAH